MGKRRKKDIRGTATTILDCWYAIEYLQPNKFPDLPVRKDGYCAGMNTLYHTYCSEIPENGNIFTCLPMEREASDRREWKQAKANNREEHYYWREPKEMDSYIQFHQHRAFRQEIRKYC